MKAMILAAGRGQRLRPLTNTLPKPLVPVNGKPLIVYHLEKLAAIGIKEVVINIAWLGHKISDALGNGDQWQLKIHYSHETEALETGGGICNALPLLGSEPFFVINGDVFVDQLPNSITDIRLPKHCLAHLWLVDNPSHNPSGDFGISNHYLQNESGTMLTFSGMGIYHPKLFDNAPKGAFGTPLLIRPAADKQLIHAEHFKGLWCDVGTVERLHQLEKHIQ
ncbi:nucleotidyltransferase family protein [Parashewanella curva]|uniref:Nucleotidyltransferase family protein n=1 Tax=Parashewanella curva TaxID=2338552 RepID=A0A3L8PSN4_9GAMM|nr:nucleotidyltransferase family protein [Parashewanella curva]RLV58430.1 nucleotidyltransferase family protein [Parashewanella curva]